MALLTVEHRGGVPAGLLHKGGARHRAVCFKWICDRLGVLCELSYAADYQSSRRCFNVCCVEGPYPPVEVDCMQPPLRIVQARGGRGLAAMP